MYRIYLIYIQIKYRLFIEFIFNKYRLYKITIVYKYNKYNYRIIIDYILNKVEFNNYLIMLKIGYELDYHI